MAAARRSFFAILIASIIAGFVWAPGARATTLHLSQFSSETDPTAAVLDATLVLLLTGPSELTLTLTNDTAAPDAYLINGVWFNAAAHVTGLGLVSATHSDAGDVTAAWDPVEADSKADGFGSFDFGLTDGVGAGNPNLIGPGETVDFVLTIAGTGSYDISDFDVLNDHGIRAAAKFVSGPGGQSAFGATGETPEPGTAALLGAGLLGMALAGCRR